MTKPEDKLSNEENHRLDYWHAYWRKFAEAYVHPLTSNGLLSNFTANTAVTGAYAEAWIKWLVSSMLPQYRISTGAVITPSRTIKGDSPQCDLIVWNPSELPALFEINDFALVPNLSARAIIEVKRSARSDEKISKLDEQLRARRELLRPKYFCNVIGIVVHHPEPLFPVEIVSPDWLTKRYEALNDEPLKLRLLGSGNAPATNEIFAFIYFLAQLAKQE